MDALASDPRSPCGVFPEEPFSTSQPSAGCSGGGGVDPATRGRPEYSGRRWPHAPISCITNALGKQDREVVLAAGREPGPTLTPAAASPGPRRCTWRQGAAWLGLPAHCSIVAQRSTRKTARAIRPCGEPSTAASLPWRSCWWGVGPTPRQNPELVVSDEKSRTGYPDCRSTVSSWLSCHNLACLQQKFDKCLILLKTWTFWDMWDIARVRIAGPGAGGR